MNQDQAKAQAEIVATFEANIAELSEALAASQGGYVLAWPDLHLGVLMVDANTPRAVRLDRATVYPVKCDAARIVVTNGRNDRAVIVGRDDALRAAIENSRTTLENFKIAFATKM